MSTPGTRPPPIKNRSLLQSWLGEWKILLTNQQQTKKLNSPSSTDSALHIMGNGHDRCYWMDNFRLSGETNSAHEAWQYLKARSCNGQKYTFFKDYRCCENYLISLEFIPAILKNVGHSALFLHISRNTPP